jgi:hypothetical protein
MLNWIYKYVFKKIDLPIVLIFFIIICIVLSDKREGFKEGVDWGAVGRSIQKTFAPATNWVQEQADNARRVLEEAAANARRAIEKAIDDIKNAMNEFVEMLKRISPERIQQELRAPFDRMRDVFQKPIDDARKGFEKSNKKISGPFEDFFNRMRRVGDGMKDIFEGIGDEFVGLGTGLRLGFTDIGLLLEYTGEYMITNILCGLKMLFSLPFCAFFYMMDIFGQILYMPIRILLFLIYSSVSKNIYELETYVWKQIRAMDNIVFENIGYYLTRWPKNIRDQCYNCKRLKLSVLQRKADDVNTDFRVRMPDLLGGGVKRMMYGGDEILSAFH